MTPERLNLVLAVGALVLLAAVAAVRLTGRLGLPSLLGYLAIGLLLGESGLARELDVDVAPLDDLHADLLQVTVPEGSRLAGVYLDELRLPPGAAVTLLARLGRTMVPDRDTRILVGDQLVVVTASGL